MKKSLWVAKKKSSQLEEINVQNETAANGNIYPLEHFDKPDELELDDVNTEENVCINGSNTFEKTNYVTSIAPDQAIKTGENGLILVKESNKKSKKNMM